MRYSSSNAIETIWVMGHLRSLKMASLDTIRWIAWVFIGVPSNCGSVLFHFR